MDNEIILGLIAITGYIIIGALLFSFFSPPIAFICLTMITLLVFYEIYKEYCNKQTKLNLASPLRVGGSE